MSMGGSCGEIIFGDPGICFFIRIIFPCADFWFYEFILCVF